MVQLVLILTLASLCSSFLSAAALISCRSTPLEAADRAMEARATSSLVTPYRWLGVIVCVCALVIVCVCVH